MSKSLATTLSQDLGYNATAKAHFHRLARKRLKALVEALGLASGSYEIRSNRAGPAVSGEVILHSDNLYVQVSQPVFGRGTEILYRTCRGRQDYTGGTNHFAPASLLDPEGTPAMVARIRALRD